MQGEKQLRIAKYFGEANQMGEDGKFKEELLETIEAYADYLESPSVETLKHLLSELNDCKNVAEGVYRLMGGSLEEIASEKEFKLCETIKIINKIPQGVECRVKAYDQERYSGRYDR